MSETNSTKVPVWRRSKNQYILCDNTVSMTFDDVVKEFRTVAPGRVTVVSYDGIKFARDCGIDCWHLAGTMCFQHVIRDCGTEAEKQRLRDMKIGYPW